MIGARVGLTVGAHTLLLLLDPLPPFPFFDLLEDECFDMPSPFPLPLDLETTQPSSPFEPFLLFEPFMLFEPFLLFDELLPFPFPSLFLKMFPCNLRSLFC
jgi:hypothetical protein